MNPTRTLPLGPARRETTRRLLSRFRIVCHHDGSALDGVGPDGWRRAATGRLGAVVLACAALLGGAAVAAAEETSTEASRHRAAVAMQTDPDQQRQRLDAYFRSQTEWLTERTMAEVESADDWQTRRGEYRRQLAEMLGLDPMPPRTDLSPEITGRVEEHGVIVENLHFQSMPGLYVTGNLYRPVEVTEPLPTILYVCGHARAKQGDISFGGKTSYHHHGLWFARNGYVCLTIDTIQLGEIEGIHHGTYRYDMWWWNNRGYTPAGVEAWNGIRALDYLSTREEVDTQRFGITGRSGGGAYSWWVAALDDRIAAAVPVAGITSLHNHVVDGCVEGHCDCMYQVNTYRWDFPLVAALVAPRPLLISNTDKDRIFPLEGVVDVHQRVRRIYRLLSAGDKLGLQITEGPHRDTQELHIHAFRWFNRFLRDTDEPIEIAAVKKFRPEQLRVFEALPADERVTEIHESFVPAVDPETLPESLHELRQMKSQVQRQLAEKTFGGWPSEEQVEPLDVRLAWSFEQDGVRVRQFDFTSQSPHRLPLYLVDAQAGTPRPPAAELVLLDADAWDTFAGAVAGANAERWQQIVSDAKRQPERVSVYLAPRGIGPTDWGGDERKQIQIRRRFMLLGQTLAGMQVWDALRGIEALRQLDDVDADAISVRARGPLAALALHTALADGRLTGLRLDEPPQRNRDAPDMLNVSRTVELPQAVLLAADGPTAITIGTRDDQAEPWRRLAAAHRQLYADAGPDVQPIQVNVEP